MCTQCKKCDKTATKRYVWKIKGEDKIRTATRCDDHVPQGISYFESYDLCYECNATGRKPEFANRWNGVCFNCDGTGIIKSSKKAVHN